MIDRFDGRVAQRTEHLASNQRVAGSIPAATANSFSSAREERLEQPSAGCPTDGGFVRC